MQTCKSIIVHYLHALIHILNYVLFTVAVSPLRAGDKHQRSSSDPPQSPPIQPPRRRARIAALMEDSLSERDDASVADGNEEQEDPEASTLVAQYLSTQATTDLTGGFSTLPPQPFVAVGPSGQRRSSRRRGNSAKPTAGSSRQQE